MRVTKQMMWEQVRENYKKAVTMGALLESFDVITLRVVLFSKSLPRTTVAELQSALQLSESLIVQMIEAAHVEALAMNEEFDRQLKEIENIEYQAVMGADLVKVASLRVYLYNMYQRQGKFNLMSYSKHIEPLFNLLEGIAKDLNGSIVCSFEYEWIIRDAAETEWYEREEASRQAAHMAEYIAKAEPTEDVTNPFGVLLSLMGEDAFCKAFLNDKTYEAYKTAKAVRSAINWREDTWEDLHPARETGFERELRNLGWKV